MGEKTMPFDAAKYLDTAQSQIELLEDAIATADAGYIANALGVIARARGMSKVARDAGLSREGLYTSLSADGDPRLTTLLGVLGALGLKMHLTAA